MQAGTPNYVGTKRTERDAAFPTSPHHAAQQKFDKDVKSLMEILSVSIEIATAALDRCSNDVGSATELIVEGATDAEQIAKGAGRRHDLQDAAGCSSRVQQQSSKHNTGTDQRSS